jgi:hypothetical protein
MAEEAKTQLQRNKDLDFKYKRFSTQQDERYSAVGN